MIALLILLAVACAAFSAGYAARGERVRSQVVSAVLLSVREEDLDRPVSDDERRRRLEFLAECSRVYEANQPRAFERFVPYSERCKCSECMINRERRAN